MTRPILFRSLRSTRMRSGSTGTMIQGRGSDWSHIRSYSDTDDIRDIVWTKINPGGLSTRIRETHGDYHIISYLGTTAYDGFSLESPHDSRGAIIQALQKNIEISAKFAGYRYTDYTGFDQLIRLQPKNSIILITGIEITQDIGSLAYHNDLIYLDITHPWESDPTVDILFSGQTINTKKYLQEYKKIQDSKKNILKNIKASYVAVSTQDDIVDTLNTFFKNRYHHG